MALNSLDDGEHSNILLAKTGIHSDYIGKISKSSASNHTLSAASLTDSVEYSSLDLGFIFEINFKLFLKQVPTHLSVLCVSTRHQVIRSQSASLLREILEQVMIRRWIAISYFALRFIVDNLLVFLFSYNDPALLSNLITLCILYELVVFNERIEKTKQHFNDLRNEARVQAALKQFYGHDCFNYSENSLVVGGSAGLRHAAAMSKLEADAHDRNTYNRHSLARGHSVNAEALQRRKYGNLMELTSRAIGSPFASARNPIDSPAGIADEKAPSEKSGVGGLFKGFRTRKILSKGIIPQEEKDRLTKLAFDALEMPVPPSFGEPTSSIISPKKAGNADAIDTSDIDSRHIHSATNTTHAGSTNEDEMIAVDATPSPIPKIKADVSLKSKCPFSWNKAAFDPHEFFNFEFEDIDPVARAIFEDRSYAHTFKVRGPTYFVDQTKADPGPALMKLMLMELYEVEPKDGDRHDHIASRGLARQRLETLKNLPGNPFIMVVNFQIAGDPPVSLVSYFALPPDVYERFPGIDTENCLKLLEKFISMPEQDRDRMALWGLGLDDTADGPSERESSVGGGYEEDGSGTYSEDAEHTGDGHASKTSNRESSQISSEHGSIGTNKKTADMKGSAHTTNNNAAAAAGGIWGFKVPQDIAWPDGTEAGTYPSTDFRNCRLKLVPFITDGPWVVRTAVAAKPVILGKKIIVRYFRGDGYAEIDAHIGSSVVANQITGLCRGYAKHFTADLGIMLEPRSDAELPEKLLACVGINKIDVDLRRKLD